MDVEVKIHKLHFAEPFKIAYEKVTSAPVAIVRLTDKSGKTGLGCGSADKEVCPQTIGQIVKAIKQKLSLDFFDQPLFKLNYYHQKIQRVFKGWPVAQQAVEEAYVNLCCCQAKQTLADFFGQKKASVPMGVTLGIKGIEQTIKDLKSFSRQGYVNFKLKGGLNYQNDLRKIKAVSAILPSKASLILDANQGYSFVEAQKSLKPLAGLKIKFLEQPINAKNLIGLKKLSAMKILPIIADEAARDFLLAKKIITQGLADGLNVKLMKIGGPLNFLKIYKLAKKHRRKIMIGCMYESNISITTGVALALALDLDYVELDSGHFDFKDDPAKGGVTIKNGRIFLAKPLWLK